MIDFSPLFSTMKKKNITQYRLIQLGVGTSTIHRLKHNKSITLDTLNKLCELLKCQPGDIIRWTPDSER